MQTTDQVSRLFICFYRYLFHFSQISLIMASYIRIAELVKNCYRFGCEWKTYNESLGIPFSCVQNVDKHWKLIATSENDTSKQFSLSRDSRSIQMEIQCRSAHDLRLKVGIFTQLSYLLCTHYITTHYQRTNIYLSRFMTRARSNTKYLWKHCKYLLGHMTAVWLTTVYP